MLRAIQRQGNKKDEPNEKFPHDLQSYTLQVRCFCGRRKHAFSRESVAARPENDEMLARNIAET
jgi:hypothetical protein